MGEMEHDFKAPHLTRLAAESEFCCRVEQGLVLRDHPALMGAMWVKKGIFSPTDKLYHTPQKKKTRLRSREDLRHILCQAHDGWIMLQLTTTG